MKLRSIAATACIAISFGLTVPASAAPSVPHAPSLTGPADQVTPVRGCHGDVERHFVPEVGRRVEHRHRSRDCAPVIFEGDDDDEWDGPRDCHRDVQRHYVPEYGGRIVHRHSRSCRVIPLRRYEERPPSEGFCVQIGPVRYCE